MALSVAAASVLFLAIAFINLAGNTASGPSSEQIALLEMWQQPYHTTTMLWNAASDDSGSDMSDQSGSAFTQDLSDSSESDEKYSTSNYDSGRLVFFLLGYDKVIFSLIHPLSHDSDDDSLKQILPSSVLGGDGQAVHTHQVQLNFISNSKAFSCCPVLNHLRAASLSRNSLLVISVGHFQALQ
jgi:hypothetical protein